MLTRNPITSDATKFNKQDERNFYWVVVGHNVVEGSFNNYEDAEKAAKSYSNGWVAEGPSKAKVELDLRTGDLTQPDF